MTKKEKLIETCAQILRVSEAEDLDDSDYPICDEVLCHNCPAYQMDDESHCRMRFLRDWWWDNVMEKK